MPSKSKAQARLMAAAAHNPAFAKKVGIPQSVGKEFNQADKGKKFSMGGKLQSRGNAPGLTRSKSGTRSGITQVQGGENQINKQETRWGSVFGESKGVPNTTLNKYIGHKEGGKIMAKKEMMHEEKGEMKKDLAQDKAMIKKAFRMHDTQEHKGSKGTNLTKLAKGGTASARADGCATKGKTKGKIIAMCGGGKM